MESRASQKPVPPQPGQPDRPLRILFIASRYPDGIRPNLGLFVARQVRHLADRPGFEVAVIAPIAVPLTVRKTGYARLRGLPREEVWDGVPVWRPRFGTIARLGWLSSRLLGLGTLSTARRLHARQPFDIISAEFAWPEGPAAVLLGRKLGLPVSLKARGADFEEAIRQPGVARRLLAACHAADGLLAVSGDVKAAMVAAGLPAAGIQIHYPAVDTAMFRPGDRAAAKRALGLSGPVLICVGNLIKRKRVDLAIRALPHLPDATLLLVGSGAEQQSLERPAAEQGVAGRVRFLHSVPNEMLPPLYGAADVAIHCPDQEGFANVRLEALACGTPLVTTGVGEAETLIRSPEQGRIVPSDPRAIAQATADLITRPSDPDTVRAAAFPYSWERATDQLAAHLRAASNAADKIDR